MPHGAATKGAFPMRGMQLLIVAGIAVAVCVAYDKFKSRNA